jgi:hypothetical protein
LSSKLENPGSYARVVFGTVTLNSGSAYNSKTGIFTAPTDGIYSFTWTFVAHTGYYFNTQIVINGNVVGYNYVDGKTGGSHYEASSATAMIKMKKRDKVWIRTYRNEGQYAIGHWSSFSGFRV